jgi:hypothetical protein
MPKAMVATITTASSRMNLVRCSSRLITDELQELPAGVVPLGVAVTDVRAIEAKDAR